MTVQSSAGTRRGGSLPILEVTGILLILVATALFVTQLSAFTADREQLPAGITLASVPANGMNRVEAAAAVEQVYGQPVTVYFRDQAILLQPDQVSFRVDSEAMLSRAQAVRSEGTFWPGFWDYLWRRPEAAQQVELIADYSREQLEAWVADVAARYDAPPSPPATRLDTLSFAPGTPGYTIDQAAAVEAISEVLFQPTGRSVTLVVEETEAQQPGMEALRTMLVDYLVSEKFRGVATVRVIDGQTGEEMSLDVDLREGVPSYVDCQIAYAALSTMKIPIMVEFFRYLAWEPYPFEYDMVESAMTLSSNLNANFMLRDIGFGDIKTGTQTLTSSMQYLGLPNTFIVAGYDEEDPPEYYSTPAREAARAGTCVNTFPDPYMQSTGDDLARLLDMIYQCAEYDGGGLRAAYPEDVVQQECQMMLDVMGQNDEGRLILAGVPESVVVAHKHGYTTDTISDAGVVFSPGGDYVIVIYLWADVGWLASTAFPLFEGISTATFNYFNPDLVLEPRRGIGDVLNTGEGITPAPTPGGETVPPPDD